MTDGPSFIPLLVAIARGQARGALLLETWARNTSDVELAAVLERIADRERHHAAAFRDRLDTLGSALSEPEDPHFTARLACARNGDSDRNRFETLIGSRPGQSADAPDGLERLLQDSRIDPETGALLGRFIAEERDSQRQLHTQYLRILEAENDAPPGRDRSDDGKGSVTAVDVRPTTAARTWCSRAKERGRRRDRSSASSSTSSAGAAAVPSTTAAAEPSGIRTAVSSRPVRSDAPTTAIQAPAGGAEVRGSRAEHDDDLERALSSSASTDDTINDAGTASTTVTSATVETVPEHGRVPERNPRADAARSGAEPDKGSRPVSAEHTLDTVLAAPSAESDDPEGDTSRCDPAAATSTPLTSPAAAVVKDSDAAHCEAAEQEPMQEAAADPRLVRLRAFLDSAARP